jgi:hypothetical protein
MTATIAFMDDHPKSIASFKPLAEKYGFKPRVFQRPRTLGNFCERVGPDILKGFVLDMHIKDVENLEEINMKNVETQGGETVGLSVVEQYLRQPSSPFLHTPVALLTGFDLPPGVQERIDLIKIKGPVAVLDKRKGTLPFEKFIKTIAHQQELTAEEEIRDINEGLQVVLRILDELGLNPEERSLALGNRASDESTWRKSVQNPQYISIWLQDRIAWIIDMKARLDAIFGDDPKLQREWLDKPQSLLSGQAPIELLRSGHENQLVKILGLLRRITG